MSDTRLIRALKVLLPSIFPREPFLGPRKYRLVNMKPSLGLGITRAELQIVTAATGLPDLLLVDIWPGLAGSISQLQPGCMVLVDFIDGDRNQPRVCAFSTADDPGWRPISTQIDASTSISLGATGSPAAARVGDHVNMGLWQAIAASGVITGIVWIPPGGGTPVTIPIAPAPPVQLTAKISSGSGKTGIE